MAARPGSLELPELEVGPKGERLTHYLFRYPAKFHPPVVRALLDRYTQPGQRVLDPFCGSGTLLVEAAVSGRNAVGFDIDPLAVFISSAKVQKFRPSELRRTAAAAAEVTLLEERQAEAYIRLQFKDISEAEYESQASELKEWIPAIPNLKHWFRLYVILDLARILRAIESLELPPKHHRFCLAVFASIIRNASNADPVPVSGLEVTRWMRERDRAGRLVNPFALFRGALATAETAVLEYSRLSHPGVRATTRQLDATALGSIRPLDIDAVMTSPPYHGAVDYYRRHQLEMFWLGLTATQKDRLDLLNHYIGRPAVPSRHPLVGNPLRTDLAREWDERIRASSPSRANAFRHYLAAMTEFFAGLSKHLQPGMPAVLVVGHSSWNSLEIPTTQLFEEIAADGFALAEVLTYPVKNRYMSYARHNSADISREYVLVLKRTDSPR